MTKFVLSLFSVHNLDMPHSKHQSNAVTKNPKSTNIDSMANSSNITNNTETANSNGELNVVSSASLVTSKNQQTKTSNTIAHPQLSTSTTNTSPQVITVVASTSSNQPQGNQKIF